MPTIKNLQSDFDRLTLELTFIEEILSEPPGLGSPHDQCLRNWLELIARFVGCDFGQVWRCGNYVDDSEEPHTECFPDICWGEESAPILREISLAAKSPTLPGRAIKQKKVFLMNDIGKRSKISRAATIAESGMTSAILLPLRINETTHYVLELFAFKRLELDEPTLRFLNKISRIFENLLQFAGTGIDVHDENEFQTLLDSVPAMVWYKDRHNLILACNKYAAEITGLPVDQIVGRATEEVYPKDAAKYYQDDLDVIKTGKPKRRIIESVRGKNDETIWVSTDKIPYVKNGKVEGIIVFATDISELKHAEEELRKIKDELESKVEKRTLEVAEANIFFTLSRELLCIATGGYFTRLNPVWSERLGYSTEELLARPYIDFVHEDDRERTLVIASQLQETGHVRDFENRYVAKDGTIRWLRWSATAFGEVIYAVAYDITDRKRAEQELIDINARFTQIGKHMPGMIYQCVYSVGGMLSFPYVSEGCRELLGYEPEEIERDGSLATGRVHPEDRDKLFSTISQAARTLSVFRFEGRLTARDGSIRFIRASSTPEQLENGDVLFNGLLMDLTDLKQAQDEIKKLNIDLEQRILSLKAANEELESISSKLEQAYDNALEVSKLKSEFVANISHEIRTPLSAVIGMTDLLLDTELDDQQEEYAGTARDSARSLLTIINDILDFSKIEAGKIELETIDFELQAIVEGSVDFFIKDVAAKKLSLLTYVDPALPKIVSGDPVRVRQLLINLISNAVKFTDEGEVVVRVVRPQKHATAGDGEQMIRFEISDTGIGIPESVRTRLFKPFVQADGSTTRRYGGTGLGLSICKRLVELLEGEISVDSIEGDGSLFWFNIPLPAAHGVVPWSGRPDAKDQVVFLFNGSESTKTILNSYVEAEGMQIRFATGLGGILYGLDAAIAEGFKLMAVIIDSGRIPNEALSVVDAIRRDPRYKQANLIFLADVHQKEMAERACEIGADVSIYKPFRRADLVSCVLTKRRDVVESQSRSRPAGKRRLKEPIRVLVVEDNALMRGLTVKQLERFGIEADVATNGAEAVEKTFHKDYSLLLMDCQMPVMDGFEATLEIRKRESVKGGHIPIIAMTAYAMAGDREQCVAAGMDDYLSKPVTIDQLENMLEKWLSTLFTAVIPEGEEAKVGRKPIRISSEQQVTDVAGLPEDIDRVYSAPIAMPPMDIEKVAQHYGTSSLREILTSFTDELDELIPALMNEVKRRDIEKVARLAHQLKGLVAVLTARQMSEIALNLEQACREGRTDLISDEVEKLVAAKTELIGFINNFLSST